MRSIGSLSCCRVLLACALLVVSVISYAQDDEVEPGHSIGKVSINRDLIVFELDDGALGTANLFDLANHTLHFIPEGGRYRVETGPLQWDSDFGPELTTTELTLHQFEFPFSGKRWSALGVGKTGSISFGQREKDNNDPTTGPADGGVSIGRFDPLAEAAGTLIDSAPAICVFFKPRTSGPRYGKELADRVVITWDLTEPFGNIQDFTWFKTVNRFQAVLHANGAIEMSYKELAAKDAIVGIYPELSGEQKTLATISNDPQSNAPAHLDVRKLKLSVEDGIVLKVTFETRGPILAAGDPALDGISYRFLVATHKPLPTTIEAVPAFAWTVRGVAWRHRPSRYIVFGPGVWRRVKVSGNTITIRGILPPELRGLGQIAVYAEAIAPRKTDPGAHLLPHVVQLSGIRSPEVHLASLTRKDGPFGVVYEAFHYLALPKPQDLSCTVLNALGDKFDFLAYYSDFRIDNQEAGTPSDGPVGGNVTGISAPQHDLENYCTRGRFQWEYVQPVYFNSNQMQERPPENPPVGSDHDITYYSH